MIGIRFIETLPIVAPFVNIRLPAGNIHAEDCSRPSSVMKEDAHFIYLEIVSSILTNGITPDL